MSKTNQPKNIFKNAIEEIINKKLDSLKEETAMQFAQIDKRFNDQELKADERHDIVMRALDAVMGMFKNHSEEYVLLSDQQRRVNESNDRLDRLEKIHPHGQHAI